MAFTTDPNTRADTDPNTREDHHTHMLAIVDVVSVFDVVSMFVHMLKALNNVI